MKLKVYKPIDNAREVNIETFERENGDIVISVVDQYGSPPPSNLLLILTTEGKIIRCHHINPSFGFELDTKGRIKMEDQY